MTVAISRRRFSTLTAGFAFGASATAATADEKLKSAPPTDAVPTQDAFERDYPPPGFKPGWKKPQINRLLVQDFVIFAHGDLPMAKRLLDKEPALRQRDDRLGEGRLGIGAGRRVAHGSARHRRVPIGKGRAHRHLLRRNVGPAGCRPIVSGASAQADRRPGTARPLAPLPRPGGRQGWGAGARLPSVGEESGSQTEPISEAARLAGEEAVVRRRLPTRTGSKTMRLDPKTHKLSCRRRSSSRRRAAVGAGRRWCRAAL